MIVFSSLHDPKLAQLLANGHVGVIPTDTIYGIVASAHSPEAVHRLYVLKDREGMGKTGTIIAANLQQLIDLGIAAEHLERAAHLWPNPISVELPLDDSLHYIHKGSGHNAFRIVANDDVRKLLEQTGPLLTSSANLAEQPSATTMREAQQYFGDKVDMYVEGGDLSGRPPSTVVVLLPNGRLEVARPGAIKIDEEGNIV